MAPLRPPLPSTCDNPPHPLMKLLPPIRNISFDLPIHAYYFNLKGAEARRDAMQATFGMMWGEKLVRVEGVDGTKRGDVVDMVEDEKYVDKALARHARRNDRAPCLGLKELGCVLSHLRSIRTAYLNGDQAALILEDDVGPYFVPFWTAGVDEILKILPQGQWDTIQLGWHLLLALNDLPSPSELIGGHLMKRTWAPGAMAYLISRRGMEKIMDTYFTDRSENAKARPAMHGALQSDTGYLAELFADSNYVVWPPMFVTHGKGSQLGGEERDGFHAEYAEKLFGFMQSDWRRRVFPSL